MTLGAVLNEVEGVTVTSHGYPYDALRPMRFGWSRRRRLGDGTWLESVRQRRGVLSHGVNRGTRATLEDGSYSQYDYNDRNSPHEIFGARMNAVVRSIRCSTVFR